MRERKYIQVYIAFKMASSKKLKAEHSTSAAESFTPRSYQLEIFEEAKKGNVIACLGTGTGKTFIAVLLIREYDIEVRKPYEEDGKRIFFLVPTVPLAKQQKDTLEVHTSLKVKEYYGDMNVDSWNKEKWHEEFKNNNVLVMTAEIFRIIADHAFIPFEKIQLIVIDECHRAQKDHPYRLAMKCFADLNISQIPKIFSLSASLLNGKCKPTKLEKNLADLEKTLRSKIITSSDVIEIRKYGTDPDEYIIYYKDYDHEEVSVKAKISELLQRINAEKQNLDYRNVLGLNDIVFFSKPSNCLNALLVTLESLGVWCTCKAAEVYLKEIKSILLKTELLSVKDEHLQLLEEVNSFLEHFISKYTDSSFTFTRANFKQWPHQLQRLFEIFIAAKESSRFKAVICNNFVKFDENPEEYYKNLVQNKGLNENICSIVFVRQRITAYILHQWLMSIKNEFSELDFLKPEFVIGHGSTGINFSNMSDKRQLTVLKDFRQKKCNILFATSVLEEGMDIRQCNVIIRFDLPQDFRAYVQSKGRARAQNSIYALMVKFSDHKNFLDDLCSFKTIEKMLMSKCHDRPLPDEEESAAHMADDKMPPYMPFGPRGPRITMVSSISVINRYCSSLPCDMATRLVPIWRIEVVDTISEKKKLYKCVLRMPINSPLRTLIESEEMPQKKLAKMAAALKACKILHELGELNDDLVPISCLVDKAFEDELGPVQEENTDDGVQPGTNRRRQVYEKKIPMFLRNSRPVAGSPSFLHILEMKLVTPLPKQLNPRGRPIIDPSSTTRGLAILSSKKLPPVNPFPIFNKNGKILVTVSFYETIFFSNDELMKLEEFHRFIFSDALWLENEKHFSPHSAELSCYIVPVNLVSESDVGIDWNFIDAVKFHPYDSIKLSESGAHARTSFSFQEDLYIDAVLLKYHIPNLFASEPPTFHHVVRILYDKSPLSCFDSDKFETYKQFYKVKYNAEIQTDNQPLVETIENRNFHLWKPIYVSIKQTYDDAIVSKGKQKRMNYREYLVPELCLIHPFPSSFMFKVLCIPTILFRLCSLLIAEELRQKVATEGFIGLAVPNQNVTWPEFHLESSDKELKKHLINIGAVKETSICVENPKDILKFEEKIIDFEPIIISKNLLGPSPSLILKALTSKGAGDEFDLERLEMIGDSFLKYVMSIKTYVKYKNFDEGKLTRLRSGLIQNLHLYQCAKRKNLGCHMITSCFSCNSTWLPPCYTVNESVDPKSLIKLKKLENTESIKHSYFSKQIISDKCLADCVEALIGAYLLSCGQKGALMFMSWMGLNPLPFVKDSKACPEDFENWPPPSPNPIISEAVNFGLSMQRLTSDLGEFESIINYKFKNKAYLLQAFTHPSFSYNGITDCYQRLEFLGDAVLDYLITRQLYEDPNDHSPGKLTDLRSALVNNTFFASLAVKYGYHKFLKNLSPHLIHLLNKFIELLSSTEAFQQFQVHGYYLEEIECFLLDEVEVPKVLGDLFESVAGAIYLDNEMSLNAVWEVYYPMISPALKHLSEHVPISPVREIYEVLKTQDVFGELVQKEDKTYIEIKIGDLSFVGVGPNKKVAKKSAAKRALSYLKENNMMS